MKKVQVGDAISQGVELYKANFGLVFGASLLMMLVGGVTCGITIGPLYVGLFLILSRLLKKSEPGPRATDIFQGFEKFLPSFLLILVGGIGFQAVNLVLLCIPILGWIAAILLSFAYGPILIWALMLVANKDMKWTAALGFGIKQTFNGKFFDVILAGLVAGVLGSLGVILCGVGVVLTLPLIFCIYAAAFEQAYGDEPSDPPAIPEGTPEQAV